MRNEFVRELVVAATSNDRIVLVTGDIGWGVVDEFQKKFPKRFFNAGVAEQHMMSFCAGLASDGFHPFVYSIANFPTFRCAEQIRNDVAYHNLAVTIVAVGGGLAYGNLGYSHHAVQDYALIRTMPNMLIAAPADRYEVSACVRYLIENPQPSYLRLGRGGEPVMHKSIPRVSPGIPVLVNGREGHTDRINLSTGAASVVVQAGDLPHYSMPLWGMECKSTAKRSLEKYQLINSYEDHLTDGGFGSWLLASLNGTGAKVALRALDPKVCGTVGSQKALFEFGGLS